MSEKFEHIKKIYIGTFASKQQALKAAWADKDIAQMHQLLHKLAGSSGGYGFEQLSRQAQIGLQLTHNNQLQNTQQLQQCLDKIIQLLNQV